MNLTIDADVKEIFPSFHVGYARIENCSVKKSHPGLIFELQDTLRSQYEFRQNSLGDESARPRFTLDKSISDPSLFVDGAQLLLRRVMRGDESLMTNTVVDTNNLCGLKYGLPMCVYDADHVSGDVRIGFREGPGTLWVTPRTSRDLEGHIVAYDAEKSIGSPISDSAPTLVTSQTTNVLLIVYGTKNAGMEYVQEATEISAGKMILYSGGKVVDRRIV